jgi:hypothetical protein
MTVRGFSVLLVGLLAITAPAMDTAPRTLTPVGDSVGIPARIPSSCDVLYLLDAVQDYLTLTSGPTQRTLDQWQMTPELLRLLADRLERTAAARERVLRGVSACEVVE